MPIPDKIRYVNKRFTNKIFVLLAGKRYSPIALLRHWGRKSGKMYEIPVLVVQQGNLFFFALTYGSGVDWYRNVLAANGAWLMWHGADYYLTDPCKITTEEGIALFGKFKGCVLQLFKVSEFICLAGLEKSELDY